MYFLGLAADFDGTIALDDKVDVPTREALESLKRSGRRLILVTGRERDDLERVFPQYTLFDKVVLENGAVLLDPATGQLRVLAPPPDTRLVHHLRSLGVERLSVGQAVIAGWEPDQSKILDAIRQSGLELHITFNKGALMVLPTGINKASGLRAAAAELGISPGALVGVGDAENDHSFLSICGCSVAVANAVPSIKAEVDLVLGQSHGAGVRVLVESIQTLDGDLLPADRHGLDVGKTRAGKPVNLQPNQGNILVVGPSQVGKSTFATMLLEQMIAQSSGFAVLDPEGDYQTVSGTTVLDGTCATVDVADVEVLLSAGLNPVVVLRGVPHEKRRAFMINTLSVAQEVCERSGSPAYLIVDEAHQAFASRAQVTLGDRPCTLFITVAPKLLSAQALRSVGTVCALGANAAALLRDFCALAGCDVPVLSPDGAPDAGEMVVWRPNFEPVVVRPHAPMQGHVRHAGKYATGDVGAERSFYFRGADNAQLVRARNLFEFLTRGEEISEDIWLHHLRNGDVERWFSGVIRDPDLAKAAETMRKEPLSAGESRERLRREINLRYCLPLDVAAA